MKKKYNKKRPYRIIITCNNTQYESIGSYTTENLALKDLYRLSSENQKSIVFPKKVITTKTLQEAKFYLVLIKKRDEYDPSSSLIKNEYGEFVEHVSDNPMWLIIDKKPYDIEETFWVYGYHPMTDRKDFSFIYNAYILPYGKDKHKCLSIQVFKNKLLIETVDSFDMVICKNGSEAIRLYNEIVNKTSEDKGIRFIHLLGDGDTTYISYHSCIDKIKNLTNWNLKKICRASTKTYTGKGKKLEN